MPVKKLSWVYISGAIMLVFLIALLIVGSNVGRIQLVPSVYFFLLIICDLAATALLTGALNSTAIYDGPFLKGKLKMTGPAVVFLVILTLGYRYRPIPSNDPFDLTIFISNSDINDASKPVGSVIITIGNNKQSFVVSSEGRVVVPNIDPRYKGREFTLTSELQDGYKISGNRDTLLKIPDQANPVIAMHVFKTIDSSLYYGYLMRRSQLKKPKVISNAVIFFSEFDKKVTSQSDGYFKVYLPAKPGSETAVTIAIGNGPPIFDRVLLSKNMQIITND